ncbi:MAG: hypothetical protein JW904_10320 [Spirochaetales bacterium]|nr:hypothetical protein [Spirochaetales bacterium]
MLSCSLSKYIAPIIITIGFLILSCSFEPELDLDETAFFSFSPGKSVKAVILNAGEKVVSEPKTFFSNIPSLPEPESVEIIGIIPRAPKAVTIITRRHGIFSVSELKGLWTRIDTDLPREMVYPFKNNGITKPVVSLSVSRDFHRIAILFAHGLFLSYDGGITFKQQKIEGMSSYAEPLSVAWHPDDKNLFLVGTSFSGIYFSRDEGKTWDDIDNGIPGEPVYHPAELDEVRSLCFGGDTNTFYAGMGNGQGILEGNIRDKKTTRFKEKELVTYPDGDFYYIEYLHYYRGCLLAGTNRGTKKIFKIDTSADQPDESFLTAFLQQTDAVSMYTDHTVFPLIKNYMPKRAFEPDSRAMNKRGLYISHALTQGDNYPRLIEKLKLLNMNTVVIDLKDDEGYIRVPSDDPVLVQAGGIKYPYKNIKATIAKLKKDGIYVVGRHVVFKDSVVFKLDNFKYAVKTQAGNPLPKGPEKWVDAYSEFVWDYNIRAAQAMVDVGVDEIQFDYIRFPDRVSITTTRYDHRREGQIMREALASFLKKAQEKLDVPISIDIFGYMAVYKYGNSIGQDIAEMAQYVDVVSPMFYPSHYSRSYGHGFGDRQVYYIILLSCKRTKELIGETILRPYIQAFYYKDDWDKFGVDYIGWELDGIFDSGNTDYIFWNASMNHKVLVEGMLKYENERQKKGADGKPAG